MNWNVTRAETPDGSKISNLWVLWINGKVAARLWVDRGKVYACKVNYPLEKGESNYVTLESLSLSQKSVYDAILKLER